MKRFSLLPVVVALVLVVTMIGCTTARPYDDYYPYGTTRVYVDPYGYYEPGYYYSRPYRVYRSYPAYHGRTYNRGFYHGNISSNRGESRSRVLGRH